jgi:hypothetical protein
MDYITALEDALGKKAEKNMLPLQPGDVLETSADTKALYDVIGFKPQTSVKDGVKNFVDWYRDFTRSENKKPGKSAGFFITKRISRYRTDRGYRLYPPRQPALPPCGSR